MIPAIYTLLQTPIVRSGLFPSSTGPSAARQPTTRDIPPVTLTNIPHVEPSAFSSYLKQAGALYEAFQRAKQDDEGSISSKTGPAGESRPGKLSSTHGRRKSSLYGVTSNEGVESATRSPSERPQARRQGSGRRRGPIPVAPLSTIPTVYFEEDFHLENPRVFDIVSERSEIAKQPGIEPRDSAASSGGRKALATNAILQEKLSWYMDTVEVHLISSISTASSSFFAALGNLRELHAEAAESVVSIKALRSDLATLDEDMAQSGLKIVALQRRRANMRKLSNAVRQLREIVHLVTKCEAQIDRDNVEEALSGLTVVEGLMAGDPLATSQSASTASTLSPEHLIDLRKVKALEGAGDDIAFLRSRVGRTFEARLLDALLGDLRRHVDSVSSTVTLERWQNASNRGRGIHGRKPSAFPSYLHLDEQLRQGLRTNLEGLAKCNCLKEATTAYRDALWREIKSLIRRHLPSSSDDDMESTMSVSTQGGRRLTQQEKSSVLARNLRDLDGKDAETMLRQIYSNVGEALRRLGTQVKVVLDITSTFGPQQSRSTVTSPRSPPLANMDSYLNGLPIQPTLHTSIDQEDIQQTLDMSNLLGQAVDIAQAQITKVLKVRSEQAAQLPLSMFLRYFNLNRLFADECEAISGRGGAALKSIVNLHIKDFVRKVAEDEKQHLVDGIDRDRWDAKDFSEENSRLLEEIITASTRAVEQWPSGDVILPVDQSELNGERKSSSPPTGAPQPVKDKIRSASVDEQRYILPETALTVLRGLNRFEQVVAGIPSMTQEITMSMLEYLKLFNSRSSQLILGAGATRSAGLKNITTKHLALASQALNFVVALVPYIREFVRRHQTNPQGLMIEFDKIKRLYQEHQNGINEKLVDIMSTRATSHVNSMRKINWDDPSSGVNAYMETLIKETTTLHKVLSKHLPEGTVRAIMSPVFESYQIQWQEAFSQLKVKTNVGKENMLRDVEFFKSRMSKLEGGAVVGDALIDAINIKRVAEAQPEFPNGKSMNADAEDKKATGAAQDTYE